MYNFTAVYQVKVLPGYLVHCVANTSNVFEFFAMYISMHRKMW